MNTVIDKCTEIFSNVMEVSADSVNDESSPDTIEGWDSLAHVELISALEEEFSIEIAPDEGIEIENFKMLRSFLENKLN
jgi:acyl carrier protein